MTKKFRILQQPKQVGGRCDTCPLNKCKNKKLVDKSGNDELLVLFIILAVVFGIFIGILF